MTIEDLDLQTPRDILRSPEAGVKAGAQGALETSLGLLKEASSLAKNVPFLGVIAGVLVEIFKINGVRLLYPIFPETTESCADVLSSQEVDLYRNRWEEVMYNVVKVADLVKHFSASCHRDGLCDEATFPHDFIGTIKDLET